MFLESKKKDCIYAGDLGYFCDQKCLDKYAKKCMETE